ncbi:hypothetical protein OA845_01335 [Candidatus Pelagibacter sp.]|nr:hypothetical protein [Candidatus Pelagibacter sp.]
MKIFKFIYIILSSLLINFISLNAAEVKGNADVYKVIMHKVELCTGHTAGDFDNTSTSTTQCQNPVVIGESTAGVEVDIASVSSGAVAGAFGNPALLPLGETYTHMRVHINRKMKIRTAAAIDTTESDDTDNCLTVTTTDAMYGSGEDASRTEANRKYTHKPAVAEGGTRAEMTLYMTNGQQAGDNQNTYKQCKDATCTNAEVDDAQWNYPANASSLVSAVAMQTMRSTVSTDQVALIYALASPFTVGLISPSVDMAFGTQNSVVAEEVADDSGNKFCRFSIEEPKVTITIK